MVNPNDNALDRYVPMAQALRADQARVNITWQGQNADLPDPVSFDSTEGDVKQWVTEAVRAGMPGIRADERADFRDFVVERHAADEGTPYNRIFVRPKTAFGGAVTT